MSIDPLLVSGRVPDSPTDRRRAPARRQANPKPGRRDRLATGRDATIDNQGVLERRAQNRSAAADERQAWRHGGATNDPLLTTATADARRQPAGRTAPADLVTTRERAVDADRSVRVDAATPGEPEAAAPSDREATRATGAVPTTSGDRTAATEHRESSGSTAAGRRSLSAKSARSATSDGAAQRRSAGDVIGKTWRRASQRIRPDRSASERRGRDAHTARDDVSRSATTSSFDRADAAAVIAPTRGKATTSRRGNGPSDPTVTDRPRRQLRNRRQHDHDGLDRRPDLDSTAIDSAAIDSVDVEFADSARATRWRTHSKSPYRDVKFVDERPKVKALGPAPVTYYALVVLISMFVMLGLVMVLSATSVNRIGGPTSPYTIFIRQSAWAVVGLIAMVIVLKVPYQRWRLFVIPGFLVALGLMCLPFLPGVGLSINDARSWIQIGSFTMQPSELLKLASICLLADYFTRVGPHRVQRHRWGLFPFGIVTFGAAGLAFIQGDLGSAIVLAAATISVAVIAGLPMRDIGFVIAAGVGGAVAAILTSPRRFSRLTAFLDTQGNKDDLAFQSWQGLLSIANGGLTGSGIGGSRSKMGYLPLAHSDFIFAVIADELGFIGTIAVVGGFIVLVWLGLQVARAAPDQFGTTLAAGITAWFGVQAIVNMGGVVGLMPVTGLTLPFFSAGGTSLLVSMVAAALLMNIARRGVTEGGTTAGASDRTDGLDDLDDDDDERSSPPRARRDAGRASRDRTSLTVVR